MGFPRQEHWSRLPFPPLGDLPDPGIESTSPVVAGGFFTTEPPGKPQLCTYKDPYHYQQNEQKKPESQFSFGLVIFHLPLSIFLPLFSALWIGDTGGWSPHTKSPGLSCFLASCWVGRWRHWLDPRSGEGKAGSFVLVSALQFCTPLYPHVLSAALFSGSSSKSASETLCFSPCAPLGWELTGVSNSFPLRLIPGAPASLSWSHIPAHTPWKSPGWTCHLFYAGNLADLFSHLLLRPLTFVLFSFVYPKASLFRECHIHILFSLPSTLLLLRFVTLFFLSLFLLTSLKFFPHGHQLTCELTLKVFTEVSLTTMLSFIQPFMQEIFFENLDTERKMVCERQTGSLCTYRRYNFEEKKTIQKKTLQLQQWMDFPSGSMVKNAPANVGFHPRVGKIPGGGNGNRLQYPRLENPTGREAWKATVHGAAKSQTQLSD